MIQIIFNDQVQIEFLAEQAYYLIEKAIDEDDEQQKITKLYESMHFLLQIIKVQDDKIKKLED